MLIAAVRPVHDDPAVYGQLRRRQRPQQHGVGRRRHRATRLQKLVRKLEEYWGYRVPCLQKLVRKMIVDLLLD